MAHAAAEVAKRCEKAKEDGRLDLSECELTNFPDGVFMLTQNTNILALNLNKNSLTALSAKVPQKWTQLQELQISQNQLYSLPNDIQTLSHLRKLIMTHNDFNHIPIVVYSLPIEILIANNNQIEQVAAEELKSMTALRHVDLRENPLSDMVKAQLMEREDWDLLI